MLTRTLLVVPALLLLVGCFSSEAPPADPPAAPAPAQAVPALPNTPFLVGMDLPGSNHADFDLAVANPREACRARCVADDACRAFTVVEPVEGGTAHCWLKNGVPTATPSLGATSGVVRP